MSTLVTSVTSLLIPQSSSRDSRAPSADAEHMDASADTAASNCNTSAPASDKLTSMGLPPNPTHQSQPQPQTQPQTQPQPLPQTLPQIHSQQQPQQQQKFLQLPAQQQLAQQLLPAQMAAVAAAGYTNGTSGFSPAYANYTRTLQQQQQLQNAFNVAAFQQQQHQLGGMSNPNITYQAQQNHFAQLQAPSQQQRCAITPTSTTAQSSSLLGSHQTSSLGMNSASASSNSINRSQRCGVCRGCLCKPCGVCTYCQDSPQFGGRGVKKQSCIERRCLRVLENRLQRDAPTFKARMGCNNCDDCRMPDCQICLVCLDRRFFNNRYMSGAICAKKRCNNAVSIELSPQGATLHNNNDLPPSTDRNQAHLKRSYDSNTYEQPTSAKRRGMEVHHSGIKGSPKSITPPSSNSSQQGKNVMSPNGLISDISPQRQHLLQQHMISQQFRNLKGDSVEGSLDAYRSATTNNTSAMNGNDATAAQFGQSGNYYLSPAGYFPNNAALNNGNVLSSFDAASAAVAGVTTNSVAAYQYQQQQQNLQTQLFCNSYLQQQQKFINYPKYEYYDEHSNYGTVMQNSMLQNAGANPPADPFVPPSYSEMKNAVVLQPL